jgi:hypothetical protein
MVMPVQADHIYFDAASANSLPANLPEGDHGSTVLNIGQGVQVRASGAVELIEGAWRVKGSLYASQYPSQRELTARQDQRARTVIELMIAEWAMTHASDIAQADDITRNNAARTLEESIARHEESLEILRANLVACEEGESFSQYPKLPTSR